MRIELINIQEKLGLIKKYWEPKIVGKLNGQLVKLAKFKNEFIFHHHENEDELFLVINGTLYIELENETIRINPGEFIIIPRGIQHKPVARGEADVLLFEPESTINTGNEINQLTKNDLGSI